MKMKKILCGLTTAILILTGGHPTVYAVENVAPATTQETVTQEVQTDTEGENSKTPEEKAAEEKERIYQQEPESNMLTNWPKGPLVHAASAVVVDIDSGAVLYAKHPQTQHYPASITKLLTVLVALENSELTDTVTISQASVDFLAYDDAHIGMKPGEKISMKDALHAVLLASANEVSYAVAETVGTKIGGDYHTFIEAMNTRAKELGCTGSHWVNANGLHEENHSTTAWDMARIASEVYKKQEFREMMSPLEYIIGHTEMTKENRVFQQNHKMLWPNSEYYYEYCKGGKTGYTDQAKTTLVTMADNGKMRLAAVVLGDNGTEAYTDTRAMFDYVFENFEKKTVTKADMPEEVTGVITEQPFVVLPEGLDLSQTELKVEQIPGEAQNVGMLTFWYEEQFVGQVKAEVNVMKFNEARAEELKKEKEAQEAKKAKEVQSRQMVSIGWIALVAGAIIVGFVLYICYVRYQREQKRKRWKEQKKKQEEDES